ncbi:chloride channel protein [Chitinophaga ginsengisegetis]|uniref:chloride channel protein n=1 Tax=Chitinophaga ginsengisegetis TaxID=393003 RepID=UPI000DB9FBC7|nr:chloride channel protein [Chitinophaga ginsengisegetis]MDR6565959.1 H+/Cl- antiporter ClcA [Chitinophaga ginsengisegetis]MDR6645688.1 H+/Cl- antiporter ClcA [Chitinophaga ginsengisegetis]MDR6651720.1 H+/Cl- antiporter ClcA [Chitinophaga ginsengisegetis]
MINKLYAITKNGWPPVAAAVHIPADVPGKGASRTLYLSVAAILAAAAGTVAAWAISVIIHAVTSLAYYGEMSTASTGIENTEQGWWIIGIPVAGALLLVAIARYTSPLLRAMGLTVAIGAGNPLGIENAAMLFNGGLGAWIGKLFRCTNDECRILFTAGVCSTLGSLFGAPVAAVFLALEVFLAEWTPRSILPVAAAAVTAAAGSYLYRGTSPVLSFTPLPAMNAKAVIGYMIVALLVGLWARLSIVLYRLVEKWFGKLTKYNTWYLLLAALLTGITGYISPRILGTGEGYIRDLLEAHVTLAILFALAFLKWIAWLFFSGANKAGSGIIPLLVIGGAMGLLIGAPLQMAFPSLMINAGVVVVVGMGAMLAGTTRAVLTAIILLLEMTHDINVALPAILACILAYGIAIFKNKKAQND